MTTSSSSPEDLSGRPVITVVLDESYGADGLVQSWECTLSAEPLTMGVGDSVAVALINNSQHRTVMGINSVSGNDGTPVEIEVAPYSRELVGHGFTYPGTFTANCGADPVPVASYSGSEPVLGDDATVSYCCDPLQVVANLP